MRSTRSTSSPCRWRARCADQRRGSAACTADGRRARAEHRRRARRGAHKARLLERVSRSGDWSADARRTDPGVRRVAAGRSRDREDHLAELGAGLEAGVRRSDLGERKGRSDRDTQRARRERREDMALERARRCRLLLEVRWRTSSRAAWRASHQQAEVDSALVPAPVPITAMRPSDASAPDCQRGLARRRARGSRRRPATPNSSGARTLTPSSVTAARGRDRGPSRKPRRR